jgi:4-diphosphocytidyl-2-C-methyl-D-erythritol kinase
MSASEDNMVIQAPAKVNLFLEVLGRRENGYHDVRSVVVPVSLYDTVTLVRKPSGILTEMVYLPEYPENGARESIISGKNLTSRVAEELQKAGGIDEGVLIRLEKRIPVGGGLGGGSADAAAVMCGLNEMWGLNWSVEQLAEAGSHIGCDIPALILGGPVTAEGLGEKVVKIPVEWGDSGGAWVVLVNPGFAVSTADIYSRCEPSLTPRDDMFNNVGFALKTGDFECVAANLFNGLQDPVAAKYPLLNILCEKLKEVGSVGTLVSGSGASVFGLARDEAHAQQMQAGLSASLDYPVWSKVLRMLPDGVMVAHGPLTAIV